jgi:hypothetical protein
VNPRILSPAERLSKLRAMSAREVVHRLRYAARLSIERRQHATGRLAPADRLQHALVRSLTTDDWPSQVIASRRHHRARFFPSVGVPDEMRALFEREYSRERADTLAQAALARQQRFEFFGQTFHYPDRIDWQADPVSGRKWPSVYHADSRVHGGDVGFGDVKYVWELSRQQFLIDLGKAWFLDRRAEHLQAVQTLVQSWLAANPYATGVNWSCALEPAFRVFSWLWTYYFTADDLDRAFHLEWLCGFYDHARFLEHHLEIYSSPYNHLIAEATALYMVGTCFPEFRDAERWRHLGRSILEGRLEQQFYADGGSVEQSPFYHHATVGFYLLAGILARSTGDDLSIEVWTAIERALDYSAALSLPDGYTPAIGGADDGKPIRMEHLPFWDFRSYHAIGAVLFRRPDFKYVAGRFHEDALWLLGPAGLQAFTALDTRAPEPSSRALPASGYYVMRSDWSPSADYVCVDCGEQAAGMRPDGIPNSMHGHADCLSVIVALRGRRVLVDSGLYAYNCGGEWESHFRETAAHNTATVDGRDQATHIRKMAWSHSYRAAAEAWRPGAQQTWFIGSHDGYARGRNGVRHRRAVWMSASAYVVICDEFVGTGEHDLAVNYQFAPGSLTITGPRLAAFDDEVDIAWVANTQWNAQTACGGAAPGDGWIAPSLGIKQPAPRLRLTAHSGLQRTVLVTLLVARHASERRVSLVDHGGGAVALITTDGAVDAIGARGIAPPGVIDTDALLAVCRVTDAGPLQVETTGGTHAQVDSAVIRHLARSSSPTLTGSR